MKMNEINPKMFNPKVTNAWNGKLLVASSCEASAHVGVKFTKGNLKMHSMNGGIRKEI